MLQKLSIYEPYKGINIEGHSDGYSSDAYGNLYLISILGPDSAVKGLSSGIVSGKDIEIESGDTCLALSAMRGEKYRILDARLESGLLHQIVAMEGIFKVETTGRKLIYAGRNDDIRNRIFMEIRNNFSTPILPAWKNWLLRRIQSENLIEIMEGNIKVARLTLNEKLLDSIISGGISEHSIKF